MSSTNLPRVIDVRLKASHLEYINRNAVSYTKKAVTKGAKTWTHPFAKPQLVGHDKHMDPIGRIIESKVITTKDSKTEEPPTYLQLTARITDQNAIEKILDGRYSTVSVGSRTKRVICSECNTVLTEDGLCEHKKGSYNNKGEMIHWIIDQIEYVEDSFVNEPADDWTAIEAINLGNGWVDYQTFMDNREDQLAALKLEDHSMPNQAEAKLSAEARAKLPEGSFCGPGRSFPAHDKAHITSGLALLEKATFSDSTKSKIKASLYRKGKRFGIAPTNDQLVAEPNLLTARLDDNWTKEEIVEIEDFFKANPDADLPDTQESSDQTNTEETTTQDQTEDIEKMKKEDLKDLVLKLKKELEDEKKSNSDAIATTDAKIQSLEKKIQDSETLAAQREEEINKFLDENAILEKKLRDSIISNIVDIQMTDNNIEDINALKDKYSKRQLESLNDTLDDLRSGITKKVSQTNSDKRVEDSTLKTDENTTSDNTQADQSETSKDKFSIFDRDRSSITED